MEKNKKNLYQPFTNKIRKTISILQDNGYEHSAIGTFDKNGYPMVTKIVPMLHKETIYLLMSDLSEHTKNIKTNSKVSIYYAAKEVHTTKSNNMRLTLQGILEKIKVKKSDPLFLELRDHYQEIEPGSKMWAQFLDFNFYKFFEKRKLFVEGFAKAYEEYS